MKASPRCCGVGFPTRTYPGSRFPSRPWDKLWGEEETCVRKRTGPNGLFCFHHSSPFSADQYVVSVPTGVLDSFNKTNGEYGGGSGGGARIEVYWERDRPRSPDILGIMRHWIAPGPSQGPSDEPAAQAGQWVLSG